MRFMKSCTRWDSFTNIQDLIEIDTSKFSGGIFKKVCHEDSLTVLFSNG